MTSTESIADSPDEEFERLYRREFAGAVRLAHLLTGSNDVAEDVAHEAFMRIRSRFEHVENPVGYLRVTVVNLAKNSQRSNWRRVQRERRTLPAPTVAPTSAEFDDHEELLALVDALPFRQRAVLVARFWLDLPEADIAELVGCRPGTVKSLSARALASLRKELQ